MRSITSAEAKNNFGELIDLSRAAPVAITKYDRPVVVVMAIEEYDRLTGRFSKSISKLKSVSPCKRLQKKLGS